MITGKVAAVHINEEAIRIVEATVARGRVQVENAITIQHVSRFFARGKLANLSAMVSTVTMTMMMNGFTTKKLMLCFDDVFECTFSVEPIIHNRRKGFNSILRSKKEKNENIPSSFTSATIQHKHSWGTYILQDDEGEAVSTVSAERDMVASLVREFAYHGYRVISLEAPETVLVYTRTVVPFSYDSLNKIVVHADEGMENGHLYIMTKDVPSLIKKLPLDGIKDDEFPSYIVDICVQEATNGKMRAPYVFLTGTMFKNISTYAMIAEALEQDGLQVVDLYGMMNDYSEMPMATQIKLGESASDISGDFGMCMCTLLRCYESKPENLYEGRIPALLTTKNKMMAAKVLQVAAAVFMIVNIGLTATTGYEVMSLKGKIDDAGYLQSVLTRTEKQCDAARTQLKALDTIDDRIKNVFTFIVENVDSSLNIASVDTVDMLPGEETSNSKYQTLEVDEETGEVIEPETEEETQKILVIRGYSTKSNGPIELYNRLNLTGRIGETKLIGTQQVTLPTGEQIYAFELRTGTGVKAQ